MAPIMRPKRQGEERNSDDMWYDEEIDLPASAEDRSKNDSATYCRKWKRAIEVEYSRVAASFKASKVLLESHKRTLVSALRQQKSRVLSLTIELEQQRRIANNGNKKSVWEGSEFKILLLQNLIRKLRLKFYCDVISFNKSMARNLQQLATRRAGLRRRAIMLHGWGILSVFHFKRRWLRERFRASARKRHEVQKARAFNSWSARVRQQILYRGKVCAQNRTVVDVWRRCFALWRSRLRLEK